jgi:hypothetical protein
MQAASALPLELGLHMPRVHFATRSVLPMEFPANNLQVLNGKLSGLWNRL